MLPYASQRGNPFYAYPVTGTGRNARITSFAASTPLRPAARREGREVPHGSADLRAGLQPQLPLQAADRPGRAIRLAAIQEHDSRRPGASSGAARSRRHLAAVGQQTLAHFARSGWTNTAFEIHNNQKPAANNRSPWTSTSRWRRPTIARFDICSTSALGIRRRGHEAASQIVTRVDIGHWECDGLRTPEGTATGCYKAKDFGPANARALLQPVVDRWVVGHVHAHGAQDLVAPLRHRAGDVRRVRRIWRESDARRRVLRAVLDRAAAGAGGPHDLSRGLHGPGAGERRRHALQRPGWGSPVYSPAGASSCGAMPSTTTTSLPCAAGATPRPRRRWSTRSLGPASSSDPRYRANSRTVETYVTNNVEDLLRARRLVSAIASGQRPALTDVEGFSPRYAPAGCDRHDRRLRLTAEPFL